MRHWESSCCDIFAVTFVWIITIDSNQIFIGASYTPWLTLVEFGEGGWIGNVMAVAVWTIAACGLAKSFSKKFLASIDGIVLLNLMGWIAFFIIPPALFTHGKFKIILMGVTCTFSVTFKSQ